MVGTYVVEVSGLYAFSHFNDGEVEMDTKNTLVILEKWSYLFCPSITIVILEMATFFSNSDIV